MQRIFVSDEKNRAFLEDVFDGVTENAKKKLLLFDEIDSTNDEAKKLFEKKISSLHNTMLVSFSQTKGRGRLGRVFVSPFAKGLYFSFIMEKKYFESDVLTALVAVATSRALESTYKIETNIKWVNDIFFKGKKISGILCEALTDADGNCSRFICGVGINILPYDFSEELRGHVGSVFQNEKADFRDARFSDLISRLYENLLRIQNNGEKKSAIAEYKAKSFLLGKKIFVHPIIGKDESYEARVVAIDDEAHLIVQPENGGTRKLFSGEVSIGSYAL